jgi:hypothetical protein
VSRLLTEPLETINLTLTGPNVVTPSMAVLSENDTANQFRNQGEIDFNLGGPAALIRRLSRWRCSRMQFGSMRCDALRCGSPVAGQHGLLLVSPTEYQVSVLMADAGGRERS